MELKLATTNDAQHLRNLLNNNPMQGWVDMAVEREPDYFDGVNVFNEDYPVIARRQDEVVGMYCVSLMQVYLNNEIVSAGYLGGLRVEKKFRNMIGILREGYASIMRLIPKAQGQTIWLTCIAAHNQVARKLLEAGVDKLPKYKPIGELVTLALPTARGVNHGLWQELIPEKWESFLTFYNKQACQYQLAPVITRAHLQRSNIGKIYYFEDESGIVASISLWDQRSYKQVVASQYKWPLSWVLVIYNWYATLTSRIKLPSVGEQLNQTWLSFFCISDHAESKAFELIEHALFLCKTPCASIGLHAKHPLIDRLSTLKPMKLPLILYKVMLNETVNFDHRFVQPEAALL